jgi:hypothetical protein
MSSYIREALKNWIDVYSIVDFELSWLWLNEKEIEKVRNNGNILQDYILNNK